MQVVQAGTGQPSPRCTWPTCRAHWTRRDGLQALLARPAWPAWPAFALPCRLRPALLGGAEGDSWGFPLPPRAVPSPPP